MKKIIIIFIIAIVVFFVLYQYKINYIDIKHDDFSITKQFILESIEDKRNIVININGQLIDIDDFEIQKKALDVYTEEEQNELNKNNEIIETIKHVVVLQEAEKEKITPDFDVKAMETIASGMYENSDKVLSKDEYIKKWVEIQKENEIKKLPPQHKNETIIFYLCFSLSSWGTYSFCNYSSCCR